jgi:putative DNA primase/helicase
MMKPTLEGQKPNRKARVKSPKEKPAPTEPKPSPSVNGHVDRAEPFDTPPRSFYISAAQVKQEKLSFLMPDYVPANTLTLITGESNAGKSTFLSALSAGVTRGRNFDGSLGVQPGRVLMFSPEEQVQVTLRARLEAENANLPMVFFGDYDTSQKLLPRMSLPNDCGRLCERLKTMHIRLVTIDPITSYLASGFNPSNDSEVRGLLDTLSQIAAEAQCTILISRHYRKSTEGTPLDRIGGAAAWGHYPRTVIACGFDPDDPDKRVMAVSKCMVGKMPASLRYEIVACAGGVKFVLGEKTSITAADMGVSSLAAPERDALADAEDFLKSALADGPVPCNDLKGFALKNMIAEATLRRAKKRLGVQSQLIVNAGDRYQVWKFADIQINQ